MSCSEVFSIIKDICLASAATITAVVAWHGVESWKKELKGKADFEVARDLIKTIYHLRDKIEHFRWPFMAVSEFPKDYLPDSGEDAKRRMQAEVFRNRWNKMLNSIQAFDTASLEAEALWGSEIEIKAKALRLCYRELNRVIHELTADAESGGRLLTAARRPVVMAILNKEGDDNKFTGQIEAAISGLEAEIRPHLSRG